MTSPKELSWEPLCQIWLYWTLDHLRGFIMFTFLCVPMSLRSMKTILDYLRTLITWLWLVYYRGETWLNMMMNMIDRKRICLRPPCIIFSKDMQLRLWRILNILCTVALVSKLSFKENPEFILKKCSLRLQLLRRLNNFGVNKDVLQTVYKNQVESILSFNMILWYVNLNIQRRNNYSE